MTEPDGLYEIVRQSEAVWLRCRMVCTINHPDARPAALQAYLEHQAKELGWDINLKLVDWDDLTTTFERDAEEHGRGW